MKSSKTFFHSNIKFLRENLGLTQAVFSQEMNIDRNKLQALESGKTINPVIADLVKFSGYFKLSVDTLIKTDLSMASNREFSVIARSEDQYVTGANLRVLAISVDNLNKENVEYVPIKAKAGYQTGYSDPEFIAGLPKVSLPNLPPSGTYRMFPTIGTSMLPIPVNSEVIGEYVADWKSLKPDTPCIVILNGTQDFVFKLITMQQDGKVLLKSLNHEFEPYLVNVTDILEVWKYFKHQTGELPKSPTGLGELKEMILKLTSSIEKK